MENPYASSFDSGDSIETQSSSGLQKPVERKVSVLDAYRFAFKGDDAWSNIFMVALFQFIPIVGPIATMGWHAEALQRLVRQHPKPLPKLSFDDFGDFIGRGAKIFVVQLALVFGLMLPLMLLIMVPMAVFGQPQGGGGRAEFQPVTLLVLLFYPLFFVVMVVIQAAVTRAELTEDWSQAFSISGMFSYATATWWPVLWTAIVLGFLAFPLILGGMIACFVGIYVSIAVIQIAQLHVRWQVYNNYVLKGGEPIVAKEPTVLASEKKGA